MAVSGNIPYIPRKCQCCGKTYFSDEIGRRFVCSEFCAEQLEDEFYQEQLQDLEGFLDNLLCDYVEGFSNEAEFKTEWNMALYDAERIKNLKAQDIREVASKKKEEYNLNEAR